MPATREAVEAIAEADLILIGPGSFYTSLLPILLLDEMAQALRRTPATMVFIDNLGKEHSPAANLTLADRVGIMEHYIGKRVIDAIVVGPKNRYDRSGKPGDRADAAGCRGCSLSPRPGAVT